MSPRPAGRIAATLLHAIIDGHRYGSDIMAATRLPGGTVYKVLRRLEERGMIEGRWEDPALAEAERRPRRRFYRLTPAGHAELREGRRRYDLPDRLSPEGS